LAILRVKNSKIKIKNTLRIDPKSALFSPEFELNLIGFWLFYLLKYLNQN
jgi:hypothetical protein